MKVIGAGFGRTGTESTQAALEKLLGGKCYHMKEVINRPEHLQAWADFAERGRQGMDWHWLMQDYVAGVDWPICNYYQDLMAAFPDVKVLLTYREPEKWYASFLTLVRITAMTRRLALFVPMFRRMQIMVNKAVWHIFTDVHDQAHCIEVYKRHVAEVKAQVPPERLLVFQVQEGWEPLCKFLNVPVPDEPFPHLNKRGDVQKFAQRMIAGQVFQRARLPLALVILATLLYFIFMW